MTKRSRHDPTNKPRRTRRMVRLATAVLSLAVGLGLAELTLRIVWTPPALDRAIHSFDFEQALQRDSELGYIPRPNAIVEYPPFDARFTTNAAGLRGREIPIERDPARRRIVVLGDSFAWGHGISTGRAFPELIDDALPNADVVNLGVPGYDLRRALAFFNRVGRDYRPDLIIVSVCQNDIRDDPSDPGTTPPVATNLADLTARATRQPATRGIKKWLRRHSYLFALLQQTVNTNKPLVQIAVALGLKEELAGYSLLDDNLRPALIDAPPPVRRARARIVADILAIRDAARAINAEIVVALIPCIQAVDHRELVKSLAYTRYEPADFDLDLTMELVANACQSNGITIVNPLNDFRAAFERGERLYLPGDLHFNEAGHALFARCIIEKIEKSILFSNGRF